MAPNRSNVLSGMFWNGAESFTLQFIQLGVSIVLARLLTASDFGLIAMLSIFIALSNALVQGGFNSTIIMRPHLTDIDYSTSFMYNLVVSLITYIILFSSAPVIAKFYEEPQLVPLVRILSLVNILNAGYFVQDALLQKQMRFKILAIRNILASLISGGVAIMLAFLGFGVWSLVALTLTRAFIVNLYLWLMRVWKLSFRFSYAVFKKNFTFGSRMMVATVTGVISNNLHNLLIGKYFSKTELGYYYQAKRLYELPIGSAAGVITKTTTPHLSSCQLDFTLLNKEYLHVIKLTAFIMIPVAMILFVIGEDLIVILFSTRWIAAAAIFRIIILGALFAPFIVINGQSVAIMGDSKFYLRFDSLLKVLILLVSVFALQYSLSTYLICVTSIMLLQMMVNCFLVREYYRVGIRDQMKQILPFFFFSLIAAIPGFVIAEYVIIPRVLRLMTAFVCFAVIYLGLATWLKKELVLSVKRIIQKRLTLMTNKRVTL